MECKRLPKVYEIEIFSLKVVFLYSMKIKEQTRKPDAGSPKHSFEVADKADVVWRDFRRVLVQNSGLIVSLKHQKNPPSWAGFYSILFS